MRSYWISAALALMPVGAMAQGWIMPRPCIMPLDDRPIVRPAIRDCGPTVVRTRSDVRAELVGNGASRVIRFEVEERFVDGAEDDAKAFVAGHGTCGWIFDFRFSIFD